MDQYSIIEKSVSMYSFFFDPNFYILPMTKKVQLFNEFEKYVLDNEKAIQDQEIETWKEFMVMLENREQFFFCP